MQIVPAQIWSYRYKNERSVAFKIRQNLFSAGAPSPGLRWGSSRRSPRPLSRLERGHPSPNPTPLGTDPPSVLAMRPPPEVQPDLRLCVWRITIFLFLNVGVDSTLFSIRQSVSRSASRSTPGNLVQRIRQKKNNVVTCKPFTVTCCTYGTAGLYKYCYICIASSLYFSH